MVGDNPTIDRGRLSPNKEEGEKVIHSQPPPFSLPSLHLGFTYIYPPPTILPWLGVVGSEQAIERVEVEEKGKEGEER